MVNAIAHLINHLCSSLQRGTVLREIQAFGNDLREKRITPSG